MYILSWNPTTSNWYIIQKFLLNCILPSNPTTSNTFIIQKTLLNCHFDQGVWRIGNMNLEKSLMIHNFGGTHCKISIRAFKWLFNDSFLQLRLPVVLICWFITCQFSQLYCIFSQLEKRHSSSSLFATLKILPINSKIWRQKRNSNSN